MRRNIFDIVKDNQDNLIIERLEKLYFRTPTIKVTPIKVGYDVKWYTFIDYFVNYCFESWNYEAKKNIIDFEDFCDLADLSNVREESLHNDIEKEITYIEYLLT